jgi:GTP-binding protein Era
LNKIDLIDNIILNQIVEKFGSIFNNEFIFPISITNPFNLDNLLNKIIELSPEGNPYFSKDQITDKSERFFVNEIIREKILNHYDKEIPYSVEVETTSFKPSSNIIKIESQIYVERSSQKGILIGHKGSNLKIIGTKARADLEQFFQKKVFIDLKVKVLKNWKSEDKHLKRFGYDLG